MPWVTIDLMEGHTDEQKADLFKSVTSAISNSLDLPEEHVRIQLVEMDWKNHSIGGKVREK